MSVVPDAAGPAPAPTATEPTDADAVRAAGAVLGVATATTGLMAGLFYAFDVSVMPGLARADDRTFVTAMRGINRAIENPVFAVTYAGALLAPAAAAVMQRRVGHRRAARWAASALACYGAAVAMISGVHVPLNDRLARDGDPGVARAAFERRWVAGNIGRTVACTAALACLGRALVLHGRGADRAAR